MRIAITGGIGEGKSTVLAMLTEMGEATESADRIAREIFLEPATNAQIAAAAGLPAPVAPADLRGVLSTSDEVRAAVNRIMHPRIVDAIERSPARFVEVPLLIEACLYPRFDRVWGVTCGPEEQRKRLLERYADERIVSAMLASQLPTRTKIPFCDLIFRTNQPLETVRRLLSVALARLPA